MRYTHLALVWFLFGFSLSCSGKEVKCCLEFAEKGAVATLALCVLIAMCENAFASETVVRLKKTLELPASNC